MYLEAFNLIFMAWFATERTPPMRSILRIFQPHWMRWSQRNFAEKIGVRRTWISKIENGHCTPMLPSIQKIAEAFDVAPHALLVPPKEL
jgi:DNA-binding XRE family transcriptional regulator